MVASVGLLSGDVRTRQAIVFALVGWCFLLPPLKPNGQLDLHAPLARWQIFDRFNTAEDCEDSRWSYVDLPVLGRWDPKTGPAFRRQKAAKNRRETMRIMNGICVPADDPRIIPK
jgi:hypothetical protein